MKGFDFTIVDLTHTLDGHIPTWSGNDEFNHALFKDYNPSDEYKFRKHTLETHMGCGTHIDAPTHCMPGGKDISELTMDQLVVPCFVVDVSAQSHAEYIVSKEDILKFEEKYGRISEQSFVIVRTGWEENWHKPEKYRNNLIFPSVSAEAAQLLADRNIAGLGVDTLSPDLADAFPVHKIFLESGRYLVENIANAKELPPIGSFAAIMPLKVKGGTESPVRAIAFIPRGL